MKHINTYITEKLKISKPKRVEYTLFPETRDELVKMISEEIYQNGNLCSLNHVDTSKITDMSSIFYGSEFNGDILKWDVSNVKDMSYMFKGSAFNGDISEWDVSNVENMEEMFFNSKFNNNISQWDISNVLNMEAMFYYSKFNQDISNWKINNKCIIRGIFYNCHIKDKYKPFKNGERIK